MSSTAISPLRYPGGKSRISTFIEDIINLNDLNDCTIYELYAGGAGASLNALFSGVCDKIVLNDLDKHIYWFWKSVKFHTDELIKLINDTAVDIDTWHNQREVYVNYSNYTPLEVGFATFYLNRCNRSGILQAGPIGGKNQTGNYKIDVRFNKANLIQRIQIIARMGSQISLENKESINLISTIFEKENEGDFLFLDPPYYVQGENLYFSSYTDEDHARLAQILRLNRTKSWFLTYDNCDRIKELYSDFRTADLPMTYTLQEKRKSKEIMIFSDNLDVPKQLRIGRKSENLLLIE